MTTFTKSRSVYIYSQCECIILPPECIPPSVHIYSLQYIAIYSHHGIYIPIRLYIPPQAYVYLHNVYIYSHQYLYTANSWSFDTNGVPCAIVTNST